MVGDTKYELAWSGDVAKMPSDSETKYLDSKKKSIHFTKQQRVRYSNKILFLLRPGDRISPMEWENIRNLI
jgi:hypothetical protein